MYYLIGFSYIEKTNQKNKFEMIEKAVKETSEIINYFSYEVADIKTLLYDLSCGVRGLGGCKQSFKTDDLPSIKAKQIDKNKISNNIIKDETEEERLKRHKEFFENLKASFKQ